MKITFKYDLNKDVWCLLNYGKESTNSQIPTKVYEKLVFQFGENPTNEEVEIFLEKYYKENKIDIGKCIISYQQEWDKISDKYKNKSEKIFGVQLKNEVIVYLTANNRCPYNIPENFFFVSVSNTTMRKIVMHELWHFYTWFKFGVTEEEKIGKQRYNETKESLTVLLNVEFPDLMNGLIDSGYPQHQEIRNKILDIWKENKNMEDLWEKLAN